MDLTIYEKMVFIHRQRRRLVGAGGGNDKGYKGQVGSWTPLPKFFIYFDIIYVFKFFKVYKFLTFLNCMWFLN